MFMEGYSIFNQSLVGFKHQQAHYQNEDHCDSYQDQNIKMIAIADGHGARECFRSCIGSKIATDTALDMLKIFSNTVEEYNLLPNLHKYDQRDVLIRELIHDLIEMWNNRVHEHIKEYPIQEEEYMQAKTLSTIYQKGKYLTNIYGTTLLCALVSKEYILILQQGDGCCLVIDEDGNFIEPVEKDDLCVRHMTTSLCDKDADKRMRYVYYDMKDKHVGAIYLATDGLTDSFSDDIQMRAFFAELSKELVKLDPGREGAYLRPLMNRISEYGSKDDITLAGIINRDVLKPVNEYIDLVTKKAMDHRKMVEAQKQWLAYGNQKKQLNETFAQLQNEIDEWDHKIALAQEEKARIFRKIEELGKKHSQVISEEKQAKEYLETCMDACKQVEIELQRKE